MAIGPQQREALRKRVHEQYKDESIPVTLLGLHLALRGFEISRRRLDNNVLEWDQYVALRGHYNATASGVLDALHEKGLTPQSAQMWKKTHARYWTELEEPAYMTQYCKELFQQLIPHLQAPHSSLVALNNLLVLFKEKGSDPKNAAVLRSSIAANTLAMNTAGFGIEVRALRSIYGFDADTDFLWMEKYVPKLNRPLAVPTAPQAPLPAVRSHPKGLQKCAPSSDFDSDPMGASEPVGEPWEEALGTPAGAVPSPKTFAPPPEVPQRPKGLRKSPKSGDPFDISEDSFGM